MILQAKRNIVSTERLIQSQAIFLRGLISHKTIVSIFKDRKSEKPNTPIPNISILLERSIQ